MIEAPGIGSYRLGGPVLLAPMAGITDAPFRRLCRRWGASLATSEMTTADVRLWQSAKSERRLAIDGDLSPRVVQIAGSVPEEMAEAARLVVDRGAEIVDINMGCPAKKVCRRLAGSALLCDEDLVRRILAAVVRAVDVPVTLKMRTGWDPEHRNGPAIARIAEQSGIAALAVHGRTRRCAYRGDAEFDTIREIKLAVDIPVFANGDVLNPLKAERVLEHTGADGVMIGRAARGRPWLLQQVNDYLERKILVPDPSMHVQRATIIDHLENTYRFYGEQTGVRVARKHLAWFTEHMVDGAKFRKVVMQARDTRAQMQITKKFLARRVAGENTDAQGKSPPVSATWRRPAVKKHPPERTAAKPRLPA